MRRADAAKQSLQSEPRCSVPAKCTSLLKLKTPAHPILFPRNCSTDFRNIHTAQLVCTGEANSRGDLRTMNNQINWLLHPPVDGPRATILIRVMAGTVFLWEGIMK